MSRRDAVLGAVAVSSVVGFFAVALVIGFVGTALAGLRDGLGTLPTVVAAASMRGTATPAPTPAPSVVSLSVISPIQIGTPVPVLATIDAIMTSHAQRSLDTTPLPPMPELILESSAGPTEAQPTATATVRTTQLTPTLTATSRVTRTPTIAPSTVARPPTRRPKIASPTATRAATAIKR